MASLALASTMITRLQELRARRCPVLALLLCRRLCEAQWDGHRPGSLVLRKPIPSDRAALDGEDQQLQISINWGAARDHLKIWKF